LLCEIDPDTKPQGIGVKREGNNSGKKKMGTKPKNQKPEAKAKTPKNTAGEQTRLALPSLYQTHF